MNGTNKTLYTAIGRFQKRVNADSSAYPVVPAGGKEHQLDLQEMTLWTILNWRLLYEDGVLAQYNTLARELLFTEYRTPENCLARLVTRGLAAQGQGATDADALYDLLAGLYVVPISESMLLRTVTFLKMILLDGVPFARAKALFRRPSLSTGERQVLSLARQALLSTAELVKCVELGISDVSSDEKLMDALYSDDDTTSDNLGELMRFAESRGPVTLQVAGLCLQKQILFERV